VEYAIFIPLETEREEGGIWMDEGTLADWDNYLEESKVFTRLLPVMTYLVHSRS
jgi:hypothetical protein